MSGNGKEKEIVNNKDKDDVVCANCGEEFDKRGIVNHKKKCIGAPTGTLEAYINMIVRFILSPANICMCFCLFVLIIIVLIFAAIITFYLSSPIINAINMFLSVIRWLQSANQVLTGEKGAQLEEASKNVKEGV